MSNLNDLDDDSQNDRPRTQADDPVARLISLAGPRDAIPADVERRVHARTMNEWQRSVARVRIVRWAVPLGLAAGVVVAIAMYRGAPEVTPEVVPEPIATVARISGSPDASGSRLSIGDPVYPGETIATAADQGVSLAMNHNMSLRLAAATTAVVGSTDEITLTSGRIYVDSGQAVYHSRHLTINTDGGNATDIGTQFAVSYLQDKMGIAVREGKVDVSTSDDSYTIESGNRLVLNPDSGAVFSRISKYDDAWNWAVALAPTFEIDNRSLLDFLTWAARETGKDLTFANDDVRSAARRTILRGSVAGFTPAEALESVLATTQFEYHTDERRIAIDD